MELVRFAAPAREGASVALHSSEGRVVFQCTDADTAIVAASLADRLRGPFGVWLTVTPDYPAQLAARDLRTLAALCWLEHAAIESASRPLDQAAVVSALLSPEQINFANDVAQVVNAYSRPAPLRALRVWAYADGALVSGSDVLRPGAEEATPFGRATRFS